VTTPAPQDPWASHSLSLGQYPSPVAPVERPRRPRWLWPAVLTVVLTLAGGAGLFWYATSQRTDLAAAPAATTPAVRKGPPASGGRYSDPEQLAAAIKRAGETCAGLGPVEHQEGRRRVARCNDEDGEWVILATMEPEKAQSEYAAAEEMGMADRSLLAGENWTIVGRHAYVERLHEKLGGRIGNGPVPGS
jgi:hypothetical protein